MDIILADNRGFQGGNQLSL